MTHTFKEIRNTIHQLNSPENRMLGKNCLCYSGQQKKMMFKTFQHFG